MISRFRCTSNDVPFFRILVSFRSMLTVNRYCQSFKILNFIRLHFDILKSLLPVVLYEVTTGEEILLVNDTVLSKPINAGIYLALLKYNKMIYQPLIDFKLTPLEIFPQKLFLPKIIPFIIYDISPFVKTLTNLIDYVKEYEKTKAISRKHPNVKNESNIYSLLRSISQLSTVKRSYQTKSHSVRGSSTKISPDLLASPVSRLSVIPIHTNYDVDIRRYLAIDPQRINQISIINDILPFKFRIHNRKEQRIQQEAASIQIKYPRIINIFENNPYPFDENELVLLQQHLSSLTMDSLCILDLQNCIHQLALDKKLDKLQVCDLLTKLNHKIMHNQIHHQDVLKTIQDLQEAASSNTLNTSHTNLSDFMKILLRISYLAKFNKLDKQKVNLFHERLNHLAKLGVLTQHMKLFKKLLQLDLFGNEPNLNDFAHFVEADLQRIIPKSIPLNDLGMKEILHQIQLNTDRLGLVTTLILIDNLQQLVHSGLLLNMRKTPQLKRYLIQFIEQIQTSQLNGNRLQRLIEQMNITKKNSLSDQLNALLQKTKLLSKTENREIKNSYDELVSALMKLAYQGRLNMFNNVITQQHVNQEIDTVGDNLQSILNFLYEQSVSAVPSGPLPQENIDDFIRYLRHFAQYGILHEPTILNILTDLHRAKDRNSITLEVFKTALEHMKTINYVNAYDHLNLIDLDKFLSDVVSDGYLTRGQAWFLLDNLINLCRMEPITNHDIKTLLINIQLEYNCQQPVYPKLMDSIQSLAESYSSSLAELRSFERELKNLLASSHIHIRRIPDEIRKRLNDIISLCKTFSNNYVLLEKLFGQTMNYKFYNKMKEMFKSKNLLSRKQSSNAIVQIHKHFLNISRSNTQSYLTDNKIDRILQIIHTKCSQQANSIEETLKNMAQSGNLQNTCFVDYLNESFLHNESSLVNDEKRIEIQTKSQKIWPLSLDLNHSDVRQLIEHLQHLEQHDKIHTGTLIEIQNRINQLARFGKCSLPQIKYIFDEIRKYQGKTHMFDKDSFQLIQSYCLMLNDITNAIEFEFYIQQITSENKLSDELTYRFRYFLYQILHNELSITELRRYRPKLNKFHCLKQMDIDEIKKFIDLLPKEFNSFYPLTLTDKLLERLKFDGKIFDTSIRNQLLKFERSGIVSRDNFEDIYNNLHRTLDLSSLSLESTNNNQLLIELFDKINDLYKDGLIDLQKSIEIKEHVYFLEDNVDLFDASEIISYQSRLLNSSKENEFFTISYELKKFVYQEQYRLSKAQDLISIWHLNERKGNLNEKQILKLLHELANLNQLYSESNVSLLSRYIELKQVNSHNYRQLIKDLQRLRDRVLIDKQAIECARAIEVQIYTIDLKNRFNEILIKKLENHLKQTLRLLMNSSEQHLRNEFCKKLHELVEDYVKSNTNEDSFDELLTKFDLYITRVKTKVS